ncbi:MAG TPA: peptidyl-alpha-hydroxyglycine alpha-amidating lyase family protein [Puia sp.]|nr:peptidyl-alpha-hydroxyglycine alpha-amidating lyase family protein [Puia sp.]
MYIHLLKDQAINTKNDIGGSGNYELVKDWPRLPADFGLGNPTGLGIDSNQHIFVFHRAERKWPLNGRMPDASIVSKTILMLERDNGEILNSWGDNLFIMPHGLTVDAKNDIWVTDVGLHQVFKFSHEGKLLFTLGEPGVSGTGPANFNLPTDVAVAKDGSFYVSDGYGNSRVVKFSPAGQYLFEWGKKGSGQGEFNLPHAIDLDDNENVYVADRENNRVQVFDPTGKFIKQWKDKNFGRMSSVVFDKLEKGFVAVDYTLSLFRSKVTGSDILLFDPSGNFVTRPGNGRLKKEGRRCWYHNVAVDDQGSIYITDILGNRIKKFKKVPEQLAGR